MAKMNPIRFMRQVKQEVSKVTWPTRKETAVTTLMVFILGTMAAVFFLIIDQGLSFAVQKIIGLGK
jgi:preprotein translocase subunit SecE